MSTSWLNKVVPKIKRPAGVERKTNLPEGLWSKCPACEAVLYATDLQKMYAERMPAEVAAWWLPLR